MKKRLLLAVFLVVAMAAALPGTAVARVDGGCSQGQGWERFEAFVDDVFQADAWLEAFPTNAAAIADGIYTIEDVEQGLGGIDRNGNGWVCVKDVYDHNGQRGQGFSYYVSTVDDNAAR